METEHVDDATTLSERVKIAVDSLQNCLGVLLCGIMRKDIFADAKTQTVRYTILPMVHSVITSIGSVKRLADPETLGIRDCYPICRSIVETAVNICFILARGDSVAMQALTHAYQKGYRDAGRDAGPLKRFLPEIVLPKAEDIPGLSEALSEYSTKSGGEISKWTEASVDERTNAVRSVFGWQAYICLFTSRFLIYRHASEILHGTFHGVMYFSGANRPGSPLHGGENTETWWREMQEYHEHAIFGAIHYCQIALLSCHAGYLMKFEPERGDPSALLVVAQQSMHDVYGDKAPSEFKVDTGDSGEPGTGT